MRQGIWTAPTTDRQTKMETISAYIDEQIAKIKVLRIKEFAESSKDECMLPPFKVIFDMYAKKKLNEQDAIEKAKLVVDGIFEQWLNWKEDEDE